MFLGSLCCWKIRIRRRSEISRLHPNVVSYINHRNGCILRPPVWRLSRRLNLKSVQFPIQASQASATDLRLWSSYVQLLALLGSKQEAVKVAEKALSMVQVRPPFRVVRQES